MKRLFEKTVISRFAVVVVLFTQTAMAQTVKSINGQTVAYETSEPVVGAVIGVQHKNMGSITNAEGRFFMAFHNDVSPTDSLVFSSLGYQSVTMKIRDFLLLKNAILKMRPSTRVLREVIVRPLSLQQLIDSINIHNKKVMASPVKLSGYYREFSWVNSKCVEYSDALCEYLIDRTQKEQGQFKINASRCIKAAKDRINHGKYTEIDEPSFINPLSFAERTSFEQVMEDFLPKRRLLEYKYTMQASNDGTYHLSIFPKQALKHEQYKIDIDLTDDFTLKYLFVDIPKENLKFSQEFNFLWIFHLKVDKNILKIFYTASTYGVYPSYYLKIFGFHGRVNWRHTHIDQRNDYRSEFLISRATSLSKNTRFNPTEVYKKENLCENGASMNEKMLTESTFIKLTKQDSVLINSINQ